MPPQLEPSSFHQLSIHQSSRPCGGSGKSDGLCDDGSDDDGSDDDSVGEHQLLSFVKGTGADVENPLDGTSDNDVKYSNRRRTAADDERPTATAAVWPRRRARDCPR